MYHLKKKIYSLWDFVALNVIIIIICFIDKNKNKNAAK
jgi:predicted ABC-type sugar transport system permease subunit